MKHFNKPFKNRFLYGFSPKGIKITMLLIFSILFSSLSYSPSGTLRGRIFDKDTKEPISFANIVIELGGNQIAGTTSDFDGNYLIRPIPQGTYSVRATYVGYKTVVVKGVIINGDQIRFFNIEMESTVETLAEIVVTAYKVPLISKDETVSGGHVTSQEIKKMPNRNASSVVSCVGGVFSSDGERGNVRGATSNQTVMYIDGIRVLGTTSIPQSAIQQTQVPVTGLPASNNVPQQVQVSISQSQSPVKSEPPVVCKEIYKTRLLTAGEINDFSKWELWEDISKDALNNYRGIWGIYPEKRYSVQILNENSFPVVDCKVVLIDDLGNKIWEARSDNTGKAELWADMFKATSDTQTSYKIQIIDNGNIKEIKRPKVFHKGINSVKLKKSCETMQTVDILFTVDATGSMSDEINYLKAELKDIIMKFSEKNQQLGIRLGSVFYRCFGNSYVTNTSAFSHGIDQSIDFINGQRAGEGGTEAVEEALRVSVEEMEWSNSSIARLMFLVLDESPGRSEKIKNTLNKAVQDAASKGIRIIPIVASGTGYNSDKSLEYLMRSIALASNGTYVFLTDDSGIGGKHTEPSIDDYDVELLNDLIARLLSQFTLVEDCQQKEKTEEPLDLAEMDNLETGEDSQREELVLDSDEPIVIDEVVEKSSKKEKEKIWIKPYPNPTTGLVNIEHSKKIKDIYVIDISGKLLQRIGNIEKDMIQIDLSNFPNGMYFLKYANDNQWNYEKVILRH